MCAAGPCFDWYADAEGDVCDMLPLITVNDNSVIATEVTFDAGEFLPPAGEELPYATDFALYGDHRQLFAEISEESDHLAAQHPQCSVCELCLATFRDRASLEWHWNYHRSKNQHPKARYTCDVCQKECNSSSHLHLHRKVHLEHKPYPCTYGCNRSFSSSGNRQKHIARMHTHEKKFHCAHKSARNGMIDHHERFSKSASRQPLIVLSAPLPVVKGHVATVRKIAA
uniref:C2H2-type domain-containing protein n=1 Tax=Anopheles merus TaxID=30066 RepID=A0A182V938_ANOME